MGDSKEAESGTRKPLVTVERQTEHDLFTGERVERRFVKMYFEARETGLLADIPDDLWKTLCALATYIDDHGECFPSQETLARDLGVGRQAVNNRIKRLREYRFQGQAVLNVSRPRVRSKKGQTRWGSNIYTLLPIAGFTYGRGIPTPNGIESSMSRQDDIERTQSSMSSQHDIERESVRSVESAESGLSMSRSMSSSMSPLTRHKQERTREEQYTHTTSERDFEQPGRPEPDGCVVDESGQRHLMEEGRALVRKFHDGIGAPQNRKASRRELEQATELIQRLGAERAHYLIKFGLEAAKKTRFDMRHFGGVLSYEAEAEESLVREEKRKVREQHDRRKRFEEDLERRYYRWRKQILDEARDAMEPSVLESLEDEVADGLRKDGQEPKLGFKMLVRVNVEERIAAERGIPPFEQWRQEEYPKLRAAGVA